MRIAFRLPLLAPFLLVLARAQENTPAPAATPSPATTPTPVANTPAPAASPAPTTNGPVWLTDFEQAKAAAKKDGKVVVAAFVGSDWCGYSKRMQTEVFEQPAFATWAAANAVLLLVDFPLRELPPAQLAHNRDLARLYGVRGYPTVVLLDANGKQIGLLRHAAGGLTHWLAQADEQLAASKPAPAGEKLTWLTDYDAAKKLAQEQKKPLLVNFTGSDWCVFCIRLKNEIFAKPEFSAWAKEHVVLVELDFPRKKKLPKELAEQNERLQEQFGVEGFPTVVFVGADGKEISRTGYERGGPKPWLTAVEKELGIASKDGAQQPPK